MVQTIFAFGFWACNRGCHPTVVGTQPGSAGCRTLSLMGSAMPIELHSKTHMVGSRLSTFADYLGQPAP